MAPPHREDPMPAPLAVTDDQLIFIQNLVEPLHPSDRSRFLVDLAAALRHEIAPLGDGVLHRQARSVFQKYFRAPQIAQPHAHRVTKLTSGEPIA
jgi:hypothetical protein